MHWKDKTPLAGNDLAGDRLLELPQVVGVSSCERRVDFLVDNPRRGFRTLAGLCAGFSDKAGFMFSHDYGFLGSGFCVVNSRLSRFVFVTYVFGVLVFVLFELKAAFWIGSLFKPCKSFEEIPLFLCSGQINQSFSGGSCLSQFFCENNVFGLGGFRCCVLFFFELGTRPCDI